MSRRALTTYFAAAALALGTVPAFAQENPKAGGPASQGGQRPNSSGSSQGSAVERPSGGSSGGGATSSSSGDRSTSSPSGGSGSRVSPGGGGYNTEFAPARPERRAVPRNDRDASAGEQRRVNPAGGSAATSGNASDDRRRAVPSYARPREGRPTIGSAVERRGRPPVSGGVNGSGYYGYYDPYYRFSNYYNRYPYGYYYAGYGLGMGYFYDPFMFGYYSPYGYGGAYDPYYSGGYGGYSREGYRDVGSLRLKVKPAHGQVYVDGYYVGEVDSFDGIFQKLQVEAGAHRVEIRAPGFETVQFEVMVVPGETVTYKGELKRIQ